MTNLNIRVSIHCPHEVLYTVWKKNCRNLSTTYITVTKSMKSALQICEKSVCKHECLSLCIGTKSFFNFCPELLTEMRSLSLT